MTGGSYSAVRLLMMSAGTKACGTLWLAVLGCRRLGALCKAVLWLWLCAHAAKEVATCCCWCLPSTHVSCCSLHNFHQS
jgi:hypothetical protein